MDALFPLINNLATGNRDYALLIGAGVSKDAGIPTGWEILIETLTPLYITETNCKKLPENANKVIEDWYLKHEKYKDLGYSDVLEKIYKGDIERREYLKKFFEGKQPGDAHTSIAKLVKHGLLRFVFTTNFDNLLEKALEEYNIEFDTIYSDDVLESTKSWDKVTKCRIYKLHGDYKAGKIRNTSQELKKLDQKISEDFQYIIDRHGLIVVGYAGRDEAIMNHLHKRNPFHYPVYWQYVNLPSEDDEYKHLNRFLKHYKYDFDNEVTLIQNSSAANFFESILNSIESLERIVISKTGKEVDYRSYIVDKDNKKIRALSIETTTKYEQLFLDYSTKEGKDRFYQYKYNIFKDFLLETNFIYLFIEELLRFELFNEAIYICSQLFNTYKKLHEDEATEFVKLDGLYHLFMNSGWLFLKYNAMEKFRDNFFSLKFKNKYGKSRYMIDRMSLNTYGWDYVAKEIYKHNYYAKKFTIIFENHLPENISEDNFKTFDAYITMDLALRSLPYRWAVGSSVFWTFFHQVYFDYFDYLINSKEIAIKFLHELGKKYSGYHPDILEGIDEVFRTVSGKFKISHEEIKKESGG